MDGAAPGGITQMRRYSDKPTARQPRNDTTPKNSYTNLRSNPDHLPQLCSNLANQVLPNFKNTHISILKPIILSILSHIYKLHLLASLSFIEFTKFIPIE